VVGVDASESNINIANLHASRDPFLRYTPSITPEPTSPTSWFSLSSPSPSPSPSNKVPHASGSLEYRATSAESLRDAGERFDLVCAMEVLEHVNEPGEFLGCLGDMVKVGRSEVRLRHDADGSLLRLTRHCIFDNPC